jgi:hypothetical protein
VTLDVASQTSYVPDIHLYAWMSTLRKPDLWKWKASLHVLVSATISTSLLESEQLNYCVLSPAVPLFTIHSPPPPIFYPYYYVPCFDCSSILQCRREASVMILSKRFCFRNSTHQLHTVRARNRCVYMDTISRIHNTSTGFFRYNHFYPLRTLNLVRSIIHFESGTELCKPLRHSRPVYTHTIFPALLCKIHKARQPWTKCNYKVLNLISSVDTAHCYKLKLAGAEGGEFSIALYFHTSEGSASRLPSARQHV